jgi:polar amino acid transport system substrate-binding protein
MTISTTRRLFLAVGVGAIAALAGGAAHALTLDDIKKSGKLAVATEALYEPMEFIRDGKIVGYGRDILDNIAASWKIRIEQQDLPFAGILVGLQQKKYDLVATTMIMNPDRARQYAFTSPIAASPVTVLKRKGDDKLKSLDDLTGVVLGGVVPPAGPTVEMQKYIAELAKTGKGPTDFAMFQSLPDMLLALANGQIDGVVENKISLGRVAQNQPDKFEIAGTIGKPFYIGWATRPEDAALRDAINAELKRMRESGKLAELQKKWFGYEMELPETGYLPAGAK